MGDKNADLKSGGKPSWSWRLITSMAVAGWMTPFSLFWGDKGIWTTPSGVQGLLLALRGITPGSAQRMTGSARDQTGSITYKANALPLYSLWLLHDILWGVNRGKRSDQRQNMGSTNTEGNDGGVLEIPTRKSRKRKGVGSLDLDWKQTQNFESHFGHSPHLETPREDWLKRTKAHTPQSLALWP